MLPPLMALGTVFRSDKSWGEKWIKVMEAQFASFRKPYLLPACREQSNQWLARPMTTAGRCSLAKGHNTGSGAKLGKALQPTA